MQRPALLAVCLMLSACIYVPTRQKAAQGLPATPDQASFLYDDGATLAQARAKFGPPTLDLRDINVAVWSWRTSGDLWIYALPSASTGENDDYRNYSLMVAYADDGRVLTHLLEKRSAWDTASEQARKWHARIKGSLLAASPPGTHAYGLIHVYMPGRSCAHGTVDILLDGERIAELGHDAAIVTRATPARHELTARIGDLAFGMPLQLTVDATRPTYVRVCSPNLLFQPWKVVQAKPAGTLGGADVLRVVDAARAASEMPALP
ncbi:hypothetical protein [Lysobacter niastensis]|uniref:Lipoprotein n=1 Tax=Lysobacter niastensis TaxID=380629 RepID=A0ABS0BEE1_9GAMM|nr:hypothetical protein [Lysobacter niastensis]MBF6025379.1 hypothetical protein [Lysobacter niastensis]